VLLAATLMVRLAEPSQVAGPFLVVIVSTMGTLEVPKVVLRPAVFTPRLKGLRVAPNVVLAPLVLTVNVSVTAVLENAVSLPAVETPSV
jgi:hypothetical protein